jgi:hypothetical protein
VGDEGVVLTEREREALAGLAESIGDPWLARQLVGQDTPPPAQKRRFPWPALPGLHRAAASVWAGVVLLVAGAVLALVTFTGSTVLGALGLLLMGAGLWRIVAEKGDVVIRRLTEPRTPAAGRPPHTPPGAA